jgi:hypothetical protein
MADANSIQIIDFDTIQEFFEALKDRPHIRLVKVADQGLLEPVKRSGVFVMQPMVRVVATAFDFDKNKILRWNDKWDVGSGVVTLNAVTNKGRHNDSTGARTRDNIILESQKRSLQVVRGEEWTAKDMINHLAGIGPRNK